MIMFLLIYFVGVGLFGVLTMIYAVAYSAKKGVPTEVQHQINWDESYRFGLGDCYPNLGVFMKIIANVISLVLLPLELYKWSYNMIKESDRFCNENKEEPN